MLAAICGEYDQGGLFNPLTIISAVDTVVFVCHKCLFNVLIVNDFHCYLVSKTHHILMHRANFVDRFVSIEKDLDNNLNDI